MPRLGGGGARATCSHPKLVVWRDRKGKTRYRCTTCGKKTRKIEGLRALLHRRTSR